MLPSRVWSNATRNSRPPWNQINSSQKVALTIRASIPWGDLLRSVLNIKFGVKAKYHWYLVHFQSSVLIYSSNWQNNWRSLLFKLESIFLPLSKISCHTVTFSFLHITSVVWPIIFSFCFGIITNIIQSLVHILDFTSVSKWKSYNQNCDFVPFSKFTFVTVWHQ